MTGADAVNGPEGAGSQGFHHAGDDLGAEADIVCPLKVLTKRAGGVTCFLSSWLAAKYGERSTEMFGKMRACRKFVSLVLMPMFFLLLLDAPASASEATNSENLDEQLLQSRAVREVLQAARDIAYRVSVVSDHEALIEAIETNDRARAAALLGFTEEEANALNARMDQLRMEIFTEFPQIASMAADDAGSSCAFAVQEGKCDVRQAVDVAPDAVSALDDILAAMDSGQGPDLPNVRCQWGPFIGSLLLCTTLGPIYYWPCAYVALCSFCSGGWVDVICG